MNCGSSETQSTNLTVESVVSTYKLGDYCYFETSASAPYQIRQLDEFIPNTYGWDVKVFVYSRKYDLPDTIQRTHFGYVDGEEEFETPVSNAAKSSSSLPRNPRSISTYTKKQLQAHWISGRELFLNKDRSGPKTEVLPASLIRGKCSVVEHIAGVPKRTYLHAENLFFAECIWYTTDYGQKLPGQLIKEQEKGIRHDRKGTYQARLPRLLTLDERQQYECLPERVSCLWRPSCIPEELVAQFTDVVKAVGLFARSTDPLVVSKLHSLSSKTVARISGHDAARAMAHDILHECDYDISKAINSIVGDNLVYRKSLMENFDEDDMAHFLQGLYETERNIVRVHREFLPWHPLADVIHFYFLFKTTSGYKDWQQAKAKAKHANGMISSIKIADYEEKSCLSSHAKPDQVCYSCNGTSSIWFSWTGFSKFKGRSHPVCPSCWQYWKRYAALRRPWKRVYKWTRSVPVVQVPDPKCTSPTSPKSHPGKGTIFGIRSPIRSESRASNEEEKSPAQREFTFIAPDEWRLVRRVASDSVYVPRRLALMADYSICDMELVTSNFQECPENIVGIYRRPKMRASGSLEQTVNRLRDQS